MALPLRGIKVVEFGGLAPGPLVGMVLADFGADVVRIDKVGVSLNPDTLSRGKRSLAISPKHPKGLSALRTIISKADVVIDPFRPGVLERLGLGPEDVRLGRDGARPNEGVVFARITGYQRSGPYASMAGHDINYIAISGLLSMLGPKNGPPQPPINILGDFAGGSFVCLLGILMALLERTRSGKGQVVEADMVTGARYLSSFLILGAGLSHPEMGSPVNDGRNETRGTNMLDGGAPFYGVYETSDGLWMSVGALEPQFFAELVKILSSNVDENIAKTMPVLKKQNDQKTWPAMKDTFTKAFKTKSRQEWTRIFTGTDACVAPILTPDEAAVEAVEPLMQSDSVGPGQPAVPQPAPMLSRTPARIPGGSGAFTPREEDPGAELLLTPGEHTNDVLTQWADLDEPQILQLWREKAVGGPDPPETQSKL